MNKEKVRKIIRIVIIVLLVLCIGYFGYQAYDGYRTEKQYEELRKIREKITPTPIPTWQPSTPPTPTGADATQAPGATATPTPTPTNTPTPTEAVMLEKYKELYNTNNDFAGWIKIDGTPIDYPVMHIPGETAKDGKDFYYLYRDFYGNPNTGEHKPGSIFIDGRCSVFPERSDNLILYGHNMSAGTMFAGLHMFRDVNFYKEHKTFNFDTLYSSDVYEIVSVFIMQIGDQYNTFPFYSYADFKNKATFDYFFEQIKPYELFDTGVEPEYGDELITLMTCTERAIPDGRMVVIGRKIKN